MYKSLSTPDYEFGTTMYLVEKIIYSTVKPPPWFWNKKKCPALDLEIYRRNQILIQALRNVSKFFKDEVIVRAVESWNQKQLKKIYELAKGAYNVGKIIQGFRYYCENESLRDKRVAAPKDESEAAPIVIDIGQDLRKNKRTPKKALWNLISTNMEADG